MKFKKRHLFWIIPVGLLVLTFLISLVGHSISCVPSKKLITKSKNKSILTEKELNEDLDYIKYYLTTCYCGYGELVEAGFDIEKLLTDIKNECEKNKLKTGYSSETLRSVLTQKMMEYHCIEDGHFAVCGVSKYPNSLYFTDIYVKPVQEAGTTKYVVVKNEREKIPESILKQIGSYTLADVKPGQLYTGPESMLYEWFDGSQKIYRIGALTRQNIGNLYIQIDGKKLLVPVISNNRLSQAGKSQGMRETEDTLYISLVDFVFQGGTVLGEQEFKILCDNVRYKSASKKQVIIDLRSNGGGYGYRAAMLFSYLFYNQHEDISYDLISYVAMLTNDGEYISMCPEYGKSYLYSRITSIPNNIKKLKFAKTAKDQETDFTRYDKDISKQFKNQIFWPCVAELFVPYTKKIKLNTKKTQVKELPAPDFLGDIYILTDKYSGSCSEYSVALLNILASKANIKIHHLGENTSGAIFYIDPATKVLPNSGGWFYLPTGRVYSDAFSHQDFHGECYGWFPEYWVTHYNLLNPLTTLTADPELESALQGIEKWQLE